MTSEEFDEIGILTQQCAMRIMVKLAPMVVEGTIKSGRSAAKIAWDMTMDFGEFTTNKLLAMEQEQREDSLVMRQRPTQT